MLVLRGGTALAMSICKPCWDQGETKTKCSHCTRCFVNNKSNSRNQCKQCCRTRPPAAAVVDSKGALNLRLEVLDTKTADINQGGARKVNRNNTGLCEVTLISEQGCEFQDADLNGRDGIQTYGSWTHVPALTKMRFTQDVRDLVDRLSHMRLDDAEERITTRDYCPSDTQLIDRIVEIAPHVSRHISLYRAGSDTYQNVLELANLAVATKCQRRVRNQQAVATFGSSWVAGRGPLAGNGCLQRKLIKGGGHVHMSHMYIDYTRWHVSESTVDIMGPVSSAVAAMEVITAVLDKLQSDLIIDNERIGAVVVELMSGQDGWMCNPLFYGAIVEYCARNRIAFVVDEILTGLNCGSPFLHTSTDYAGSDQRRLPSAVLFGKAFCLSGFAFCKTGIRGLNWVPTAHVAEDCITPTVGFDSVYAATILRPLAVTGGCEEHARKIAQLHAAFVFGVQQVVPRATVPCGIGLIVFYGEDIRRCLVGGQDLQTVGSSSDRRRTSGPNAEGPGGGVIMCTDTLCMPKPIQVRCCLLYLGLMRIL